MYNKIMAIDDQIENEKLRYDINRDAAKISLIIIIAKLTSMNILLMEQYFLLIKNK